MKNINKFLVVIFASLAMTSCLVDDDTAIDDYDQGPNLVGFTDGKVNASVTADGEDKAYTLTTEVVGPTKNEITENVTFDISVDAASTAEAGVNFELSTTSVTLEPGQNLIKSFPITILTAGFEPPLETDPVLILNVTNVTGGNGAIANGRTRQIEITIKYLCFSDLAGTYLVEYSSGPQPHVITQVESGVYEMSTLPGFPGSGYTTNFSDVCDELTITGWLFDDANPIHGVGFVAENGNIEWTSISVEGVAGYENLSFTMIKQ